MLCRDCRIARLKSGARPACELPVWTEDSYANDRPVPAVDRHSKLSVAAAAVGRATVTIADYICADSTSLISAARPSSRPDRRTALDTAVDRSVRNNPVLLHYCNSRGLCRRVPSLVVPASDTQSRTCRAVRRARWTRLDSCQCNAPPPGRPGRPGSSYNVRGPPTPHRCYQLYSRDDISISIKYIK